MTIINTRNGTKLELCAVSTFYITNIKNGARADFEKDHGELLIVPTYEIECGGGPFNSWFETRTHKEDTIDNGTESEKRAWKAYVDQQRQLRNLIWERTARAYLLRGVKTEPPDNGWRARQERDRAQIPTDAEDLKIHWLETEAVTNPYELGMIVNTIQAQSQRTKAGRQIAADMFRRAMELT